MNTLKTERRDLAVKAKRLRREGYVTGNLFGHRIEGSIPVMVKRNVLDQFLKGRGLGSKAMLELDGAVHNTLIKEIQFDTLKGQVAEIDFQELVSDEMVRSVAEVQILNHDKVREGILQQETSEISYSALPADLVEKVVVDVDGMKVGDTVKVSDLELAKNPKIHLHTSPDAVIVLIAAARNAAEEETAGEETAETPAQE